MGIKGAQETLTAMLAGFKALRRKTKPRYGADRPQDELSGEQTHQMHINTAIVIARSPDKSAHLKTIFFI